MSLHGKLQRAGELRLAAAWASIYDEEDVVEPEIAAEIENLAGPFCGCETCVVREVLDSALTVLENDARCGQFLASLAAQE